MNGSPRYQRAQAFEKMLALREQARSENLRNRVIRSGDSFFGDSLNFALTTLDAVTATVKEIA